VVIPEDKQFISTLYPFLGCSLDRWFYDPEKPPETMAPLDLKNTSVFMKDEWEGMVPLKYNIQIQAQMAVTGKDVAALAVLIGGNQFKWAIVERNQRFIDVMLEKLQRFWEMVQNDVMPEPEAKDNAFIGQLLGGEKEGTTIVLSTAIVDVDAELRDIKEQIKALSERKSKLEAMIKKEIGTNERGLLPEGGSYTFKTVERKEYTVPASSSRQLRRLKG
jgi:predicted phage-related endonuclease